MEESDIKKLVLDSAKEYYATPIFMTLSKLVTILPKFQIGQNLYEVIKVVEYLLPRKFSNFLEIGSCVGGSLWLYSDLLCNKDAMITSIDLDGANELNFIINRIEKSGRKTKLIKKSSANVTIEELTPSYDLVHIDGDHDNIAVERDFNLVYPLVSPNGIILFHDCIEHEPVRKLVQKLEKESHHIKTFVNLDFTLGIAALTK